MPETFNSQPLCAMSIVMGLIFDDRLRRQRFRIHMSHVKPGHNHEQDVTTGSVGTFDRIVVKNGATLTLIDKHALFLFTVEVNLDYSAGYSPPFFRPPGQQYAPHSLFGRVISDRVDRRNRRTIGNFRCMPICLMPSKSGLPA
jgi:hypothetical protein